MWKRRALTRAQVAKREWMESVRLVFDYFCERTPRSFVETRDSSVVWNYKYADVEFGRLQARMRRLSHGSAVIAVCCGMAWLRHTCSCSFATLTCSGTQWCASTTLDHSAW